MEELELELDRTKTSEEAEELIEYILSHKQKSELEEHK
jgi:hypothetical protein